jgi:hypothetical protein
MTFEEVASLLAKGVPHDWLPPALAYFRPVIGSQLDNDRTLERRMFACAKYLQEWLPLYGQLEDWGIEIPLCVDEVDAGLVELVPFLAQQVLDRGSGDGRRVICASVEAQRAEPVIPDDMSYEEIVDGVIRGKLKLSAQQSRFLIEYLPYIKPKLTAIASTILDGASFAALLDGAIERSRSAKQISAQPSPVPKRIEHDATEMKGPMAKLERY